MTVTNTIKRNSVVGTNLVGQAMQVLSDYNADVDLVIEEYVTATGLVVGTKALGVDFTATSPAGAPGTVTTKVAVPVLNSWFITPQEAQKQTVSYSPSGPFPAKSHEGGLDDLQRQVLSLQEQLDRTPSFPISESDSTLATIPDEPTRAGLLFGFDSDGGPIAVADTLVGVVATAVGLTVVQAASEAAARTGISAQQDVVTTRGDLVIGNATPAASRLAVGSAGEVLTSDGTDVAWGAASNAFTSGHLHGLTINRASATEFSVGLGKTRAGTSADQDLVNATNTNSSFSKLFDSGGWDAGDGGGGVPTAAGFATSVDTWHFFLLVSMSGSAYDFGWDTDVDATNLIADAAVQSALGSTVYFRRLHSFPSTATPDFADFNQFGDKVELATGVYDVTADTGSVAEISHTLGSLPAGIEVKAGVSIIYDGTNQDAVFSVGGGNQTLPTATTANMDARSDSTGSQYANWTGELTTDTSAQIKTRTNSTQALTDIKVNYWIDDRGRTS